jgi:hypothetical protein
MNSREDDDHFPRSFRVFEVGCYSDELDVSLLYGFGQSFSPRVQSAAQIVEVAQVASVRIRISQSELVDIVFAIESESKTQHVVILMLRRFIVEHLHDVDYR